MSNQFLKLRRSSVPGKIPTTSSIDFGEIALNTYDGLAFIKKSGSNGEEIVTIGATQGSFSGSFTGSLLGTSSYALTASYVLPGVFDTGSLIITASAFNTTITFVKGDGTTFDVTVAQSGSTASASYATFAATAATASFITSSGVYGPYGSNSIASS